MTALHDLRGAFTTAPAWASDEEPPAQPTPSPDDSAPDDVAGEGAGQAIGPGEPPENPELKKLHDEAARHRVRAKDAEVKADALADQVRTLTIRLAFNTLAGDANLTDLDAAWKLAADDLRAVEVGEDGTVDTDRLGQIVSHVTERYPYFANTPTPATTTTDTFPPGVPSGRPTNTRKRDPSEL
ncbi:MAG TPA: hypothetical protein P5254_04305, partial [Aquihabitans sp.]|nr:hypothetical protein [Aquihabitans sp.]